MDKGEGKGNKPSLEIKDAAKIRDDAVKAREAEAKDVPSFQPSKKEIPPPSVKTRSRCRSHQIFGATKFKPHPFCSLNSRTSCNQEKRGPSSVPTSFSFSSPVPSMLLLLLSHRGTIHTSSSFSSPVPSILARFLLEQDCGSTIPMSPLFFLRQLLKQARLSHFCI